MGDESAALSRAAFSIDQCVALSRCAPLLAISQQAGYSCPMTTVPTTLERAFQIAGSTRCRSMDQLRRQLDREGFHDHVRALFGVSMREQLQALMASQRK
jgi:hypothetical protein